MNLEQKSRLKTKANYLATGLRRTYRKRILSSIAWIGVIVSCVYALVIWLVYDNFLSSLTDCLYAAAYAWTFIWIKQGRYTLSTYWVIAWATIQIAIGSIFFVGPDTGFHLYILILPVLIYLLLGKQPAWAIYSIIGIGAVAFIASHTLSVEDLRAPISEGGAQFIFIFNVLIVFTVVFYAIKFFADEIELAFKEQEKLVQTDSVTHLFNERYINQHASKLLSLCDRYGHPMSVLRFNIDGFSKISQELSPEKKRKLLKTIASHLAKDVRDADIFARIGTDDFVLLLPEALLEAAQVTAERIRESIASKAFQLDEQEINLTISIGISHWDSYTPMDIATLINQAHDALQLAKAEGGNGVRYNIEER